MNSSASALRAILAAIGLSALAACSGGSSGPVAPVRTASPVPTNAPAATPTPVSTATPIVTASPLATATATAAPSPVPTATATATAQPQVVHVGFQHAATTDAQFGSVAFYAPDTGTAARITVVAGSQLVFTNDGSGAPHTASGLGSTSFPGSFDNTSGSTASGSTIDGGLTWSTGTISAGGTSTAFTVPAGTYYFGCAFHYDADAMRDVIVSQ